MLEYMIHTLIPYTANVRHNPGHDKTLVHMMVQQ
jgi:hypothetical protein